jgi:hypothetical protein
MTHSKTETEALLLAPLTSGDENEEVYKGIILPRARLMYSGITQRSAPYSQSYNASTQTHHASQISAVPTKMAPSAVETAQPAVDEIKTKTLPITQKEAQNNNGLGDALPARLENHVEPLKLSGALDHLEQFDVTPVIGREYANVDLVELLHASNSDELLRDLAITSEFAPSPSFLLRTIL